MEEDGFEKEYCRIYRKAAEDLLEDRGFQKENPWVGMTVHEGENEDFIVLINYTSREQKPGLKAENRTGTEYSSCVLPGTEILIQLLNCAMITDSCNEEKIRMEEKMQYQAVTAEEDACLMGKDAVLRLKELMREPILPSKMEKEDLQRLAQLMLEALNWFDRKYAYLDAENRLFQEMLEEQGVSRTEFLSRTMELVTEDFRGILHNFWE